MLVAPSLVTCVVAWSRVRGGAGVPVDPVVVGGCQQTCGSAVDAQDADRLGLELDGKREHRLMLLASACAASAAIA